MKLNHELNYTYNDNYILYSIYIVYLERTLKMVIDHINITLKKIQSDKLNIGLSKE